MAFDAVCTECVLTEMQRKKLKYDMDSTYIEYLNDQPVACMLF